MKKLLFLSVFTGLLAFAHAQSLGFSGAGYFFVQSAKQYQYMNRAVGKTSPLHEGVRMEFNYILPGLSFPITGFNGLDFTYMFPHADSVVYRLRTKYGYD